MIMDKVKTEVRSTGSRSFYGRGAHRYAVYPDRWFKEWGRPPLLGYVWADDSFYAEREAYNRGLLPVNITFGPKVVLVPNRFKVAKGNTSYKVQ